MSLFGAAFVRDTSMVTLKLPSDCDEVCTETRGRGTHKGSLVDVAVEVGGTSVDVFVAVGAGVSVGTGVSVGPVVSVGFGVLVGLGVSVSSGVSVGAVVDVGVSVAVAGWVCVGDGVTVGDWVPAGVGVTSAAVWPLLSSTAMTLASTASKLTPEIFRRSAR